MLTFVSAINKVKVQKVQKIHTSVSAVNTCDIFRAFPVSVVVTYPNTFGFDVSRTTQQTLVIS